MASELIDRTATERASPSRAAAATAAPAEHVYRGDIDGLRALAVALVVLFHAAPRLLPGGFVGVDIFFVISGYLISGIVLAKLHRGQFSYLEFFGRRIRRIGPALVVVLLASLVMGLLFAPYPDFRALGQQTVAGAAFSANILFWLQSGYFDGVAANKPLLHLWSLGVEEQFYLVWPTILAAAALLGSRWWMLLLAVIALSFITNVALVGVYPDATFYLLPSRLWELGLGGALAWHHGSHAAAVTTTRRWATPQAWLGLGLIALSVALLNEHLAFPGWWAALPTLGTLLIVDAGPGAWPNRQLLASAPVRGTGLISYPLYLWHWPLLVFASMAGYPGPLSRACIVILTVLLAYLTYRWVEVPIRFGRTIGRQPAGVVAGGILAMMALAAGLGQFAPGWLQQAHNLPAWAFEDYSPDAIIAYREGSCFLRPNQTAADFPAYCQGDGTRGEGAARPRLLLWGDSHAAHLYPGLAAMTRVQAQGVQAGQPGQAFQLAQLTASRCPPVLGFAVEDRPHCKGVLTAIEGLIGRTRPNLVLMAADWPQYIDEPGFAVARITETIHRLHALGVPRVIVMGPMPRWNSPLPRALLRAIVPTGGQPRGLMSLTRWDAGATPDYLPKDENNEPRGLEGPIREAALAGGARYISAIAALCDDRNGCRATVTGRDGPEPMFWDVYSHFTAAGSVFFIDRIWARQLAPELANPNLANPNLANPGPPRDPAMQR